MASANLQFKIGSTFSGEGFKQAQQSVGKFKQGLGPAVSAANQLSSAFGSLNSTVGKAGTALTGLLGSFAQGGVWGAAFSAAMLGVNKAIEIFTERSREAAALAEKLKNLASDALTEGFNERFKAANDTISQIRSNFENITKHANAFRDAMNGLQSSRASGSLIALEVEKFNALMEADSEAMRKDIEATYNLKIAKEKAKNVEEEWSNKVKVASDARSQSESRINTINEQIYALEFERGTLKRTLLRSEEVSAEKKKDMESKIAELDKKEQTLRQAIHDEEENKKVLLVKEQTAIQDAANANDKMKLAVEEAAQKIAETGTKWEACDPAAFIGGYQEEFNADRIANAKELEQQAQQANQALEVANQNVTQATANAQQALNAYNNNYTQNRMWEAIQGAAANGAQGLSSIRGDVLKQSQQIAQGAADIAVQRGLADGSIRSVSGMQRVANEAARQSRIDQSNKENSQAMQEAARAARLEKMSDKAMSKADKDWLAKYNKVKEANDAERKKLEQAKAEEAEAKRAQQQAWQDLTQIKDKILQIDAQGIEDELAGIKNNIANLAIK